MIIDRVKASMKKCPVSIGARNERNCCSTECMAWRPMDLHTGYCGMAGTPSSLIQGLFDAQASLAKTIEAPAHVVIHHVEGSGS